jgi:hypothetical protein
VDGRSEVPLALVTLGDPAGRLPDWSPEQPELEPISRHPIEFPLITETQRAGRLESDAEVDEWRAAAARLGEPARAVADPPRREPVPIEDVILRRGSTRIMRRETASSDLLTWAMTAGARPLPCDFVSAGRTLLEHDLAVHAVDGVPPGAYRWRAHNGTPEPLHLGDYRDESALLCLRQPLGGDSAYTAFHCADLGATLAALGSRGYRAAQLEAGIASGRLSLAAFALGYGATGLTFFDDGVSQFFGTEESCMLVTSVGVPAYRNTPGGRPDRTRTLVGFERLMERLSLQLHRAS